MGRPKKTLTKDQIANVEKLAAVLTLDQIADFLGVSESTIRRRMHEDHKVLTAYKRGKQNAINDVAQTLIQQAKNGNTTAMIFYLKTQAGWRETKEPEPAPEGELNAIAEALTRPHHKPN